MDGTTTTYTGVASIKTKDDTGAFANRFVIPEGSLSVDSNGTFDVTDYSSVIVDVSDIISVTELPTTGIDATKLYAMGGSLYSWTGSEWERYYIPEFQSKTVTKNGTYTADEGFDALSDVAVNVQPKLQEKTVTQNGAVIADTGYDGLSSVTVNVPVPSGYIIPSGNISITTNGTHDVTSYASAVVEVPSEPPILQEKTVTENGEVTPDSGYDGLSKVTVAVPAESALSEGTEVTLGIAWSDIYINVWAEVSEYQSALSGLTQSTIGVVNGYPVAAWQNTSGDVALVYISGSSGAYKLNVAYGSSGLSEKYDSISVEMAGGSSIIHTGTIPVGGKLLSVDRSDAFYIPLSMIGGVNVGDNNDSIKNFVSATPFIYTSTEQLSTPAAYIEDSELTASAVANAANYEVYVDGLKKTTLSYATMMNGYNLENLGLSGGSHSIQLKAISDRDYFTASASSKVVSWGLSSITINGTGVVAGDTNVDKVYAGESAILTFSAQEGYELPDSVSVSGATGSWVLNSPSAGWATLTLSNPTADITVTITATKIQKTTINIAAYNCVASTSQLVLENNVGQTVTFTTSGWYYFDTSGLSFVASPSTPKLGYDIVSASETEVVVGFSGSATTAGTVYTFALTASEYPQLATPTNLAIEEDEGGGNSD